MAKNDKSKPPATSSVPTPLELVPDPGESNREAVARKFTGPFIGHSLVVEQLLHGVVKGLPDADRPGLVEYGKALLQRAEDAKDGDLALASHLLMMQAISLDKIFAEYARLSVVNKIEHLDASERFMRLALKAQSNSRATLDTLMRMHQPREQTVRHVHVNEGGQAVIADEFHHHAGGLQNGKPVTQPQTTGTGSAGECAALRSPDPIRQALPVTRGKRKSALSDARRKR